jgi:aminoglycoside phosphotransferase (APT) family kinase protein
MIAIDFSRKPALSWLTSVLRESGVLPIGMVTEVESISTGAFNSQTSFLRLHYSANAPPAAPHRLVLKCNTLEGWSAAAGDEEVRFYRITDQLGDHPPILPHCYAAEVDESSGSSYLLLQDLSETHAPPITRDEQISITRGVPEQWCQEAVIDALAQLHAYWWEHPLLTPGAFEDEGKFEIGFWSRDRERIRQYLVKRTASWKGLVQWLGAGKTPWFPSRLRSFYEQLLERLPFYWEEFLAPRFRSRKGLTLIHGDAYFCNFLCPKLPGEGPTYLLDWQSPSFDLTGYDLANLLAAFWTRQQRKENDRELKLLRRYFAGLVEHGVRQYAWEELIADYQAGLIFWILMPVQDGQDGAGMNYWWPKMQCLLEAFEDWGCVERLGLQSVRPNWTFQ